MRVRSVVPWIAVVGTLTGWASRAAVGQQLALAARTPRFFYASSTAAKAVEIDVSQNAVLGRVVSLHVEHATIGGLLAEIQRQSGLTFAYDPEFPVTRPVTLEAESITVAAALGAILVGTGVDVVLTPTSHVWLTQSHLDTSRIQEGTIVGKVTDKQTDNPLVGATVILELTRQSTITDSDGQYRFASLTSGTYTVRARYIGYRVLVASATVRADQEVVVDFPLEKSAQQLDEVVTTGTLVPTEVKALPTPVTVISEHDIEVQRPRNVQQLLRQATPAAVSWDYAQAPFQTSFSVRGASTLNPGSGQMKVLVDGIEAANHTDAAVDPSSIERIEVIRGPQAAAVYGSDAIGGVVQIFTKRGDFNRGRPRMDAQVGIGVVQTPYDGFGDVLRQAYAASVRGGGSDVSYNFGASYSHTADYLPNGELSKQSSPSVYGGMRFARGILTAEVSGRYYTQDAPQVFNPEFFQTGVSSVSKPNYQPFQIQNQTVGARISLAPTSWWRHTITLGTDRVSFGVAQTQPRLTFPGDTLLRVQDFSYRKTSIGYNTSVQTALGSGVSGALTVGFDHYSQPVITWFTFGALNTAGTIQLGPGNSFTVSRSITNNTGYFAQAQVGFRDALFLTGGLRAEENGDFGDSLGTPVSPRVGLSYVRPIGGSTFKLRGSYGRAIRAPSPGLKFAATTPTDIILANPTLGPERQEGWDAGVDLMFSSRGSLSATYYDQTAENLVQQVLLQGGSPQTVQYQNVGRVSNTGVEIEGTLNVGPVQLKAQYGYARARIEQLAPGYTGDLRVDDQSLFTPKHTAGAALTVSPLSGTTMSGGLTYVGSWNYYDFLALFRCFGSTGPCQPGAGLRNYIVAYPGFVKVNATVWQQITPVLSGFLSIDNLTNNKAFEATNGNPVMGRVSTVGLRVQY